MGLKQQSSYLIFSSFFDEKHGIESGLLLVIDNESWNHTVLANISKGFGYYPPCNSLQAALWKEQVAIDHLDPANNNGKLSGVQYYVLREEKVVGADDARYVLLTPARMAAFQPCEIFFRSCKERMARVNTTFRQKSRVDRVHATAIERVIQRTPKSVVKGCLRSAEHFRHALLARSQVTSGGGSPLSLQDVEALLERHKLCGERRRKDIDLYENEKDILGMLAELGVASQVRFKLPGYEKEVIVGDTGRFNEAVMDGGSFVLFNPDEMGQIDVLVKRKFLDEESSAQNPEFTWEPMPVPRQRTISIFSRQQQDLDKIQDM